MHCRNCGQEGHNKTKCKNAIVPNQKKSPGRPRKNPIQGNTSCQPAIQGNKSSQPTIQGNRAQPAYKRPHKSLYQPEGPTSFSSAFPRAKPGRPRINWFVDMTSSQEVSTQPPPRQEPIYDP